MDYKSNFKNERDERYFKGSQMALQSDRHQSLCRTHMGNFNDQPLWGRQDCWGIDAKDGLVATQG